jgi:protein SCO1/2
MKEDKAMMKFYASAGVIALGALMIWTSYQILADRAADPFAACRSTAVAGGTIGGAFELVDETGKTVTDVQIFQKPTLVYFGYGSCPDVCPLDNSRNVEAADLLAKQGIDVQPVFITVDPARDTPAVMAEYTDNFGPNLLGLSGSEAQVKKAADAFRVYYQMPAQRDRNYVVDHTTLTYLVLPKTGFAEFFQRESSAADMADRVSCFVKAS